MNFIGTVLLERDSCNLIYLVFLCLCCHINLKTGTILSDIVALTF